MKVPWRRIFDAFRNKINNKMTAIVGIINKQGVAFAADSAATHTVSSTRKITNHANKLFELSKVHPVGVALCGSLAFEGVEWEDIIKMYRKNIGDKSLDTVEDYARDFWNYVRTTILSRFKEEQVEESKYVIRRFLDEAVGTAVDKLKKEGKNIEKASDKEVIEAILSFVQMIDDQYKGKPVEDFKDYSYEEYMKYSSAQFDELLKELTEKKDCPADFVERFSKALYKVVISDTHVYLTKSQLIFWGYGENELFPSYHAYSVSIAIDGRLKLTYDTDWKVSETKGSCVAPFAQTDVANTVVRGVDDTLRQQFYTQFNDSVSMIKEELLKGLEAAGAPEELKKIVSGIDVTKYQDLYKKSMDDYIDANYVNKLLEMVGSLGKEDLGDMAENLVRMTCLKRHITTDEETVGGPVDVAVITKGDGFVWLKRKHYFPADINHRYFERN